MARRPVTALVSVGMIVAVLAIATPAYAHNYLVSSTPAEGELLTALPSEFSVTTNEALLSLDGATGGFTLQIQDASGLYYGDGCLSVDGASLRSGATLGDAGDYTVVWQVVSADGHPISGEFGFTWQPADPSQISAGWDGLPECGAAPPEPTPSATAEPQPTETPVPIIAPEETTNADPATGLWIGGAALAALAVAGTTVLVVRRRSNAT